MNGYQATDDVRADIAAALAESGIASLVRAGAPIFVAKGASFRLVHANRAALALFRANSLSELEAGVLAPKSPAARAIAERVRNLAAGVSRIERFDFGRDAGTAKLTFVCRRASTRTRLYVLAGLGLRLREAAAQPAAQPVAAPAPAADEAPEACADLKRSFERRYPGLKPARFLWRTDARNVVTEVTPPLAEIFGGPAVWLVGRDLVAAARDLGLDPERRLAAALGGRTTFSGVELMWPIAGADAAAPVSLGALPAFDREKGFDGWRGFGVIQLDRLQQIEQAEPSDPTICEEAAHDWRLSDYSGVVLPFPPTRGVAAEGREETATLVTLAPHERHAFREIARTLGAQGEPDDSAFAPDSDGAFNGFPPAERPAPASEAVAAPESPFDDWPVGLAIKRDRAWLHANRTLLDWLGFADLLEFSRSGGLDACGDRETTGAAKILRTRDGQELAAEIDRAPTVWRGAPAEAVVVRRCSGAQLQARIAALETSLRQRETEAADVMAILQSSSDAVALFNARGDLLGLNAAAEKLFGRSRDDAGTIRDLIAPESQGAFAGALAELASTAPAPAPRLGGQTRFGEALALQASFVRLTDAGKTCVVFRELSHASEGEVALREAKARAEAENRAKTDYLAAVTHEIRTPLNAILGFTEVIMDERFGPVGNARYREYIKDIHASGAHVMSSGQRLARSLQDRVRQARTEFPGRGHQPDRRGMRFDDPAAGEPREGHHPACAGAAFAGGVGGRTVGSSDRAQSARQCGALQRTRRTGDRVDDVRERHDDREGQGHRHRHERCGIAVGAGAVQPAFSQDRRRHGSWPAAHQGPGRSQPRRLRHSQPQDRGHAGRGRLSACAGRPDDLRRPGDPRGPGSPRGTRA